MLLNIEILLLPDNKRAYLFCLRLSPGILGIFILFSVPGSVKDAGLEKDMVGCHLDPTHSW